jgi:hypothetical protein
MSSATAAGSRAKTSQGASDVGLAGLREHLRVSAFFRVPDGCCQLPSNITGRRFCFRLLIQAARTRSPFHTYPATARLMWFVGDAAAVAAEVVLAYARNHAAAERQDR